MTCTRQATTIVTKLRSQINRFLGATVQAVASVRSAAREAGLVRRSTSRLDGTEMLKAMVEVALQPKPQSLKGIVDTLESIDSRASMSSEALRQRLNTEKAETFFRQCLGAVMAENSQTAYQHAPEFKGKGVLSPFSKTFLEDCTEWNLHESLFQHYKGSGGPSKNASAMRLHVMWEYSSRCLTGLRDIDRKTTDQQLAKEIVEHLNPGDLVIRDLGFYTQPSLGAIQDVGAFFLSRLRSGTLVYADAADQAPLDLPSHLESNVKADSPGDFQMFIFKDKFPVRMVAFKAKRGEVRRREKDYRKRCRKAKRKPSESTLRLLRYTIFITNVEQSVWPAEAVSLAYSVRWQIELLFKSWKSQLSLHIFTGTNIHRIRTLLYTKLIGLIIIQKLHAGLERYAEDFLDKEVSLTKLICWLQREGRVSKMIRSGYPKELWGRLIACIGRLLSKEDNRRRQTSQQQIDNMEIKA